MLINSFDKTIQVKIVYFGCALAGKTTSMFSLFSHFGKKDEILSIESTVGRTLFFDYGNISFQKDNWILKLHLYACTGQDFYLVTRPITLQGVDGIIFVIDSQKSVYERNIISWNELKSYFGDTLIKLPKVICFNKQDLPGKFKPAVFLNDIYYQNYRNIDTKFTIALNGEGILDSFENSLRLIFKDLFRYEYVFC